MKRRITHRTNIRTFENLRSLMLSSLVLKQKSSFQGLILTNPIPITG